MSTEAALQTIIYETLITDAGVQALIADRVFDGPPNDAALPYVSFGPHDLVADDAEDIIADEHTFQIDIWSEDPLGYEEAKKIGAAVKKALHNLEPDLIDGATTGLEVTGRRYMRDRDPTHKHGILTITATIEEVD